MMRCYSYLLILLTLLCVTPSVAQTASGIVADAGTHQPLPFATIRQGNTRQGLVTDINGRFSFNLLSGITELHVSYIGYTVRTIGINNIDTIFLTPAAHDAAEVIIKPPYEKIARIINTTIRNKPNNNPDKYDEYRYHIYYKMKVDLLPHSGAFKTAKEEKSFDSLTDKNHIIFSETYSKVAYKRPGKRQENVIASRFSGFSKTYFTNVITGILPFHVYDNYIKLNTIDYTNPIADGWRSRYEFDLVDELLEGTDTIFILRFRPKKNVVFNSLKGVVYINSNGFAISNITARTTTDSTANHEVKMEQIYRNVNGKWFPRELNYEFIFKKYPSPQMGMLWSGHSIIDSVAYMTDPAVPFDKAHPIKLDDSVDAHTDAEWVTYRFDTISQKEKNTYGFMDTLMADAKLDKFLSNATNLAIGRIPVKFIDIDLTRLLAFNTYEGTRLGLGLYTNDKISKYFTVGGWFGYGFKDKVFKYGGSARAFFTANKENWFDVSYQNNYRNSGNVNIHPEIDRRGLQNWLLAKVDKIEEVTATLHGRINYWELELQGAKQQLKPLYNYTFNQSDINAALYTVTEASLNLRYAYAEKRTPLFGRYVSTGTKYPVVYLKVSGGQLSSGRYTTTYVRALAAMTYNYHINHWGKDNFKIMGGIIKTQNDDPLPRSLLLAGTGYRVDKGEAQFYAQGGFLTMLPFTYFNDRFASLMYRHDFDRCFYELKASKPYLSIAYNVLYGDLTKQNTTADAGLTSNVKGYHEGGLILNQLLRFNYLNLAFINVNAGAYYHIDDAPFNFKSNGRFVIGVSFGF